MRYCNTAIIAFAALALAACTQSPSTTPAADPAPIEGAGEDVAQYDLRGKWGVSRLGGETLDYRISFTGNETALIWEPGCAGQGILYRAEGEFLEFHQTPQDEPREVCDIGFPEDLPIVLEALEGRWTAEPQGNGDILLSREDTQLTLEKLPVAQVETLAGEWRVGGMNGQSMEGPEAIALTADASEIWWEPRCAQKSVGYRILNERFFHVKPPEAPPAPPSTAPAPPPPLTCVIGLPTRLSDALNAIRAADRIERTPANGVRLSGKGQSITLFAQ